MSGGTGPADDMRVLARAEAAGMLEEILEASRRDAAEMVRDRLTRLLVEEMESLLRPDHPGRQPLGSTGGPEGRAVAMPRPTGEPDVSGWYVYGLTWARAAGDLHGVEGIDGVPTELVTVGSLAAVVSRLAGSRPWGADDRGEVDLEALAPRARRHESVLERILDWGAVLPLRFGVLYPDLYAVEDMLRVRGPALAESLQRVEGHCEWGLTVTAGADRSGAGATDGADGAEDGAAPEGRDYLMSRREERETAARRAEEAAAAAAGLHRRLCELASDAVVERPGGATRKQNVVLRASYLVAASSAGSFYAAAEEGLGASYPQLGLTGELTGPWPPYHFCSGTFEEVPA